MVKKCQSCGKAPAKHHIKKWENNVEFDLALCDVILGDMSDPAVVEAKTS